MFFLNSNLFRIPVTHDVHQSNDPFEKSSAERRAKDSTITFLLEVLATV